MYSHNGIKAARELYEELIRTPPIQLAVNLVMIKIESYQEWPNIKQIRKCFECAILHHGTGDADIWNKYIEFEIEIGEPHLAPSIYRRALAMLRPELIVEFMKNQVMHRAN